ncbi:MAG: type II secretion system F family protein [Planctomycetota bacterium]|nr:type II secretion system F family protein [Planctomycetota bacterium]
MAFDPLHPGITDALRAWSVQLDAGMALAPSLKLSGTTCGDPAAARLFEEASRRAESGAPIEALLEALAPALSEGERATLRAGWNSGRAGEMFKAVLEQRELWHRSRQRMRSRMVLPAAILVLASFVAPIPALALGGLSVGGYLAVALLPLALGVALWLVVSSLLRARALERRAGGPDGPAPPSPLDRLLLSVPILKSVERQRNLSEFAFLLANLASAGVLLSEALETCARAVPNGLYREAVFGLIRHVRAGEPLGAGLRDTELWPPEFVAAVKTGEETGKLDEVLAQLGRQARERYAAAVETFAEWLPRVAYALVALFMIGGIFAGAAQLIALYTSQMQ